jgi:hypothetical protein
MDAKTKDVPATDFGNMIGPIGWLEPPHGHFKRNPDFHMSLPPQSLAWRIPVFLGEQARHHARPKFEPVCKVRVHNTGGAAGLAWSPEGLEVWESAPALKGGTVLYVKVGD